MTEKAPHSPQEDPDDIKRVRKPSRRKFLGILGGAAAAAVTFSSEDARAQLMYEWREKGPDLDHAQKTIQESVKQLRDISVFDEVKGQKPESVLAQMRLTRAIAKERNLPGTSMTEPTLDDARKDIDRQIQTATRHVQNQSKNAELVVEQALQYIGKVRRIGKNQKISRKELEELEKIHFNLVETGKDIERAEKRFPTLVTGAIRSR